MEAAGGTEADDRVGPRVKTDVDWGWRAVGASELARRGRVGI